MIRADRIRAVGGYRKRYQWVEDHDLWLRLAQRGQLMNLPEVVLCYRQHAASVCWQRAELQRELMNELLTEAYLQRALVIPPAALADPTTTRAPAGPGKWARAAAKGGFQRSALKHLHVLNRSDRKLAYKARVNLEIALRLLAGTVQTQQPSEELRRPPRFPEWHERIEAAGLFRPTGRAA